MSTINREGAIAKIEKAMCEDGFRSRTGLVHKAKVYEIIRSLPEEKLEEDAIWLLKTITAGIVATNTKDVYSCDMEGFAVLEDGSLILANECGRFKYCPEGRFEVRWQEVTNE